MPIIHSRRTLIAAAGTLMAGAAARKPRAQEDTGRPALRDLSGLQVQSPPQTLPALSFTDAEGQPRTLRDYRGRGVVLNVWATWCMPCVAELPSLDTLAQRVKGDGIAVLALSSDRGGAGTVRRFYATHDIQVLPVLLDPDMDAAHRLGARGIPTTVLVNAMGQECARLEGSADWASDAALARIRALIAPERPPAVPGALEQTL